MTDKKLTDSELLVLGLVAEMPRHGYALEQVIEERGMREWTRIGFSSIYFVLGKLEKMGLVKAETPANSKAKKEYSITNRGREILVKQTLAAIKNFGPTFPSFLIGMMHWPVLSREQALESLSVRKKSVADELVKLEDIHFKQQPLPDYLDVMFEFSIGQLKAESDWIKRTLDYMASKPWTI